MNILTPNKLIDYELLDSGDGAKLERFGNNVIIRPDANCVWKKQLPPSAWQQAAAICTKETKGNFSWQQKRTFREPWTFSFKVQNTNTRQSTDSSFKFLLRLSQSKNIGIFPEQAANWQWIMDIVSKEKHAPSILNLFAYTGGATICASAAGAQVCHVDASKAAISWARQNQTLNNLPPDSIRWILDDCSTFVAREVKRKVMYDAIIMDPPAFGRSDKGKIFEFEKEIFNLLNQCKKILKPKPLFFIFNGYSMGYSATVLKNLLLDLFPEQKIEFGELQLIEQREQRNLPCSLFARFKK